MAYVGSFDYDTFDGSALLIAGERRGPGTPQVIQPEKLPGIDGVRVLHHGRASRRIEIVGFVIATTIANLLASEQDLQELIGYAGTLVHYVGGTSRSFGNCRLADYYLFGPVGEEPTTGYVDQAALAVLAQDIW